MEKSFNQWNNVNKISLDSVVDLVLTNGTPETIQSDIWLTPMFGDKNESLSILDFGCGVGRNIFDFSIKFPNWNFYGYDNINMLQKADEYSMKRFKKSYNSYQNLKFLSEWNGVKKLKFDCIYATIVFQHIYEDDLKTYLQDIKGITKRLIVSGRRFNDDMTGGTYKNTWQILESNGYYPTNARDINYSIDGDPNDHITCIYDI